MATEYAMRLRAELEASEVKKPRKPRATDWRRPRLLADGRKALAMLARGLGPSDILLTIPGSRARLYRAMDYARKIDQTIDPLLD